MSKFTNRYPTTLACIVSGILKLSRIAKMPEGAEVFRGLSGLALPPSFFEKDKQGFAGGVDPGFMSTTTDVEVAREYSGVNQGREATIFRLQLGKMSLGADVSWLSQFAGEKEMLFPPRTHLQIVGDPEVQDGVSVITLRPTVFQNIRSMEQVQAARKVRLQQLASGLVSTMHNQAQLENRHDDQLRTRLNALEEMLIADHCTQDAAWYNDNVKYRGAFVNLMRDAENAREKVHDSNSPLSRTLAKTQEVRTEREKESEQASLHDSIMPGSSLGAEPREITQPSHEVAALHSKFCQDPNFKGIRGKFATDELFALGIDGLTGPMDVQVSCCQSPRDS